MARQPREGCRCLIARRTRVMSLLGPLKASYGAIGGRGVNRDPTRTSMTHRVMGPAVFVAADAAVIAQAAILANEPRP